MALKRTSGVNSALDCIRQSRYNRRVCVPAVDVDKTRFLIELCRFAVQRNTVTCATNGYLAINLFG